MPLLRLALHCLIPLLIVAPLHATTLRIATAFDPQTMDPQALALLYHTRVVFQIHESLVGRNEQFKLDRIVARPPGRAPELAQAPAVDGEHADRSASR